MTAPTGTRESFDREVLPQLDLLYRVALRYTADPTRAEDLVQDTMLKAYRAWHRYEQGTSARAWLLAILRNSFINDYRRGRREPVSVDLDTVDPALVAHSGEDDPEGAFFAQIVDDRVLQSLNRLPAEFREVVVLSDVEGLPYAEISQALSVPVGTVKSRLFRGRRQMQKDLLEHAIEMGYLKPRKPT